MSSDGKRILIVEDDDAIRALLLAVFRRRGVAADTARNGVEAVQRLERCRYTVILLDLMMPLMTGYEFLEELPGLACPRPVVIVLSAGGPIRNLDPELVAGTIRKPFDVELLVDTVTACLQSLPGTEQEPECPDPESALSDTQ
jgi:DNA-binding response OmpR family regulator